MANRLMYGPRTEQAITSASRNKHYIIGPYRVLAYGNKPGDGLEVLMDGEKQNFNDQELEWLEAAIKDEAKHKADRQWDEIAERGDAFLKLFRQELEVERRRLEDDHDTAQEATGEANSD